MIIHNHHISPYHQPDLSRIMSNDQHRSTWTIHINHQWKERHRWLYDDVPCERCTQMTQHRRHGSLSIRSRKRFPSIARCPPASCYERSLLHSYSRCALHWCVLILERYGTYCMPQQTQSRVDRFCSKKNTQERFGLSAVVLLPRCLRSRVWEQALATCFRRAGEVHCSARSFVAA